MPTPEGESYEAPTARAAREIMRASRAASQALAMDILRILQSYSPGAIELVAVLDMPADGSAIRHLTEAAERLPEPDRTRWLKRLSDPATAWRITNRRAVDLRQRMASREVAATASMTLRPLVQTTIGTACARAAFDVSKGVGVGIRWDMIPKRQVQEVARGTAYERYSGHLGDRVARTARQTVIEGMLAGQDAETIAQGVATTTGRQLPHARTLVRTTLNAAANDAKRRQYKAMGVDRVRFLSTLDERTCRICGPMDGRTWDLGDAPRLPMHPNCRCLLIAVVPHRDGRTRAARDDRGRGIEVPADMTYEEWRRLYGGGATQVDGLPSLKDVI